VIAGAPSGAVAVPDAVLEYAAGRAIVPVWANETGGRTFDIGAGADRCFVKFSPATSPVDLGQEIVRLEWAAAYHPVPRLLGCGADETGSWLATAPLAGESAVSERWKADPRTAVRAIGAGLRALHEALPVDECPFSWSAEQRLVIAADVIEGGADAQYASQVPWITRMSAEERREALRRAAGVPSIDRLVVCHGDACAPNTLIEAGRWSGHVDLGSLGTGDRWADLAVATWSTDWNYGPGWEAELLAAYGVEADPERIAYYRLLWDLGP
jgi:kanamycin kinase